MNEKMKRKDKEEGRRREIIRRMRSEWKYE